jgi:putative acetyltransferase
LSVRLRHIAPSDDAQLAELIRSVFREYGVDQPGTVYTDPTTDHLFTLFRTAGSFYFVAEENGKILGGCGAFPTAGLPAGCAELVKLYLAPEARGKGIGKQLMEKVIGEAKQAGYSQLYLESFPEFAQAVKMYEALGFKRIDAPMGRSGHYACNLWMIKDL